MAGALLEKGSEKSPTKVRQPRKVDLRARYWAFLFDNLRRAVDEIYVTCESDQSVLECKVSCLQRAKNKQTPKQNDPSENANLSFWDHWVYVLAHTNVLARLKCHVIYDH